MLRNQSRWRLSLDENTRKALDGVDEWLAWAWKTDAQSPNSYPVNTDYAFGEIKQHVIESAQGGSKGAKPPETLPPPPPPPKRLSELVTDRTVRAVYEQQNDGSYQDALKQAALGTSKSYVVWRKIWRALDTAFQVDHYGIELAPMPRVQFLHRELLQVANLAGLADLTHEGIVEFLEDLCPCGKKHGVDAVRKLRSRWTAGRKLKR